MALLASSTLCLNLANKACELTCTSAIRAAPAASSTVPLSFAGTGILTAGVVAASAATFKKPCHSLSAPAALNTEASTPAAAATFAAPIAMVAKGKTA